MESSLLAEKVVEILKDKKASEINIIDIHEVTIMADYFVLCNGTSTTHIKTLADEVEAKLGEIGVNPLHMEGYNSARWILMDYGDVIVHIFHEEDRKFYNLERLWSEGVMSYR